MCNLFFSVRYNHCRQHWSLSAVWSNQNRSSLRPNQLSVASNLTQPKRETAERAILNWLLVVTMEMDSDSNMFLLTEEYHALWNCTLFSIPSSFFGSSLIHYYTILFLTRDPPLLSLFIALFSPLSVSLCLSSWTSLTSVILHTVPGLKSKVNRRPCNTMAPPADASVIRPSDHHEKARTGNHSFQIPPQPSRDRSAADWGRLPAAWSHMHSAFYP